MRIGNNVNQQTFGAKFTFAGPSVCTKSCAKIKAEGCIKKGEEAMVVHNGNKGFSNVVTGDDVPKWKALAEKPNLAENIANFFKDAIKIRV